jgi:hypothetical protein
MAGLTYYLKNANQTLASGNCMMLSNTSASTLSTLCNWQVTTTPPVGYSAGMVANATQAFGNFTAADALTPASLTTAADFQKCWRTDTPLVGVVDPGVWSIGMAFKCSIVRGAQGRIGVRLWKSATADGGTPVELTSGVLLGTIFTLNNSTLNASSLTWTAPASIVFNNEYLWLQCEWIVTTVATGAVNVTAWIDAATSVVTSPNFGPLPSVSSPSAMFMM